MVVSKEHKFVRIDEEFSVRLPEGEHLLSYFGLNAGCYQGRSFNTEFIYGLIIEEKGRKTIIELISKTVLIRSLEKGNQPKITIKDGIATIGLPKEYQIHMILGFGGWGNDEYHALWAPEIPDTPQILSADPQKLAEVDWKYIYRGEELDGIQLPVYKL